MWIILCAFVMDVVDLAHQMDHVPFLVYVFCQGQVTLLKLVSPFHPNENSLLTALKSEHGVILFSAIQW